MCSIILVNSKEVIDHFYLSLSTEMNGDLIVQKMISVQQLNDDDLDTVTFAVSTYHKNCFILDKVREMNAKSLTVFCDVLQETYSQNHVVIAFVNGK